MKVENASSFRSQHGEDRILAREFADVPTGRFVEVGAYNGESSSNTFHFEKALGWTGVLIEADPMLAERAKSIRPGSVTVNCAAVGPDSPPTVSFQVVEGCRWISSLNVEPAMLKRIDGIPVNVREVSVPARTLDRVLEENGVSSVDFITIDVEGHEWEVLSGFTPPRWSPHIIIIERNHHLPDRRIMRYMHRNGYRFRRTTGCNDWFYAERGNRIRYHVWLIARYYLPKYLTLWRPVLDGPVRRLVKRGLRRLGLLEHARALMGRNSRPSCAQATQS